MTVIQSEYTLKQAEDSFRQVIAADRDPVLNAIDLSLTEKPEPPETLLEMDIATALSLAVRTGLSWRRCGNSFRRMQS